ncbi:hypothetical protein [uncultured Methanobrevibacter sp.]|uniref:hypothetical protein n=1 Tax=uncultured Methanobrevibacter sp. TaxID=253161 RepID=UPI0025D92713|nr:hypothetical protein [uncultured Methanobrevibacter sp.]
MAEKKLTSIDIESYTVISTGINVLLSIIMSIIIVGLFAVAVPNSIGVMAYLIPTIIFGTMISNIFLAFTEGYLYNILSSKFGFIKLDIDEEYIKKISTRETALIVGCISLIITLIIYLAFSLIIPLFLSSLMTILMYGSQTNLAAALYQIMFLISNPLFIAIGILGSVIIVTVFTLLATYIYNILASSERGILVKLTTEDKFTQLESITPFNFAIAIGAICLILNIILGIILVISGVPIFNALVDILMSFVTGFISSYIIAVFYNFLAPKLGKLKVELN